MFRWLTALWAITYVYLAAYYDPGDPGHVYPLG